MKAPVKFKLSEEQMTVVQSFAGQVGLSVEDFCRQAVFYAINHATKRAEELDKERSDYTSTNSTEGKQNGSHESVSADAEGTLERRDESTYSPALPEQTEAGVQG